MVMEMDDEVWSRVVQIVSAAEENGKHTSSHALCTYTKSILTAF
jgi:hypothetical protein